MQDNAVCVYLCSGVCLRAVYQYFVDLRRTRGCGGGGVLPCQGIDCVKAWRWEGNGPLELGFSCPPEPARTETTCDGLNISPFPNLYVEALMPSLKVLGGGAWGR